MKNVTLGFILTIWTGMACGWNEKFLDVTPEKMKNFSFISSAHVVSQAGNFQYFTVDGLAGGCVAVFLDGGKDSLLLGSLLAAYIKKKPFRLSYDIDQRSPGETPSTVP